MNIASEHVLIDIDGEVSHEQIFDDDVQDGIASASEQQCALWLAALKENEDNAVVTREFVEQLLKMTDKVAKLKQRQIEAANKAKGGAGLFGQQTRIQPRFKNASLYDQTVAARVAADEARKKMRDATVAERRARLLAETALVEVEAPENYTPDSEDPNSVFIGDSQQAIVFDMSSGMCKAGFRATMRRAPCFRRLSAARATLA
jgi:type II secretory pathway component HofQ